MTGSLKILAVTDDVDTRLYGKGATSRQQPDLMLSCGDLPAYYLDFLVSQLNAPMYAVHGNHDAAPNTEEGKEYERVGATWIGGRTVNANGLLLAGFDGSLSYNDGAYQFTEGDMYMKVRRMAPWLWLNRMRHGRALDILLTHAPPLGIHDLSDPCHTGFKAFRWLIDTFKPRYHVHGHVHNYDPRAETVTRVGETDVVNAYPYRELEVDLARSIP
jgi:Icc-related predicted phosphoesterase